MELCSAVRKNEILPFAATWMGLEILILSETRGRQRPYIITYFGTVVPEKALESFDLLAHFNFNLLRQLANFISEVKEKTAIAAFGIK